MYISAIYEKQEHFGEYVCYLAKIKDIIDGSDSPCVHVSGDYNTDITRNNATFSRELNTWCTTHSLEMVDREFLPSDTSTEVNQAHGSVSWLDQCITTNTGKTLSDIKVLKECVSFDHLPLCVDLLTDSKTLVENCYNSIERKITNWKGAKSHNIEANRFKSDMYLAQVNVSYYAMRCTDKPSTSHKKEIESFYNKYNMSTTKGHSRLYIISFCQ